MPLRASSVTRSLRAVSLPLTLMSPLIDLSRMLPSPTAAVPAVMAVVANVPALTKLTSPPGLETTPSVPTLLPALVSETAPADAVRSSEEALMAAVCVRSPPTRRNVAPA